MKRILSLMRHGIAFEKDVNQTDIEREIDPKGISSIITSATDLVKTAGIPQVIICSRAARAKQSAIFAAEAMNYNTERIHQNEDLYQASTRIFLQIVHQLKDEWDNVLIIAHNPSITYIAEYLSAAEIGNMKEADVIVIEFNSANWAAISQASGNLLKHISS
jgi:phosphohistidine phosphatase